jgi:4-amino-4-deoxy-L-arabinose transferase-like glycosyltransferase
LKKRNLLFLIIVLLASGVWYTYYKMSFTHLFLNDAMDYASIGRNLARGDGFISSYITPLSLANKPEVPHPDLWRAPLWPLVLAVFIKLLGATDQTVAIATGFFYIAGAGLTFLVGRELFGKFVGLLSAFVYIFSSQNLVNSVSGMTETISIFMILLAIYLAIAPFTRSVWGDFVAGAGLGLFYLTRYNALLFVPFFIIFVCWRRYSEQQLLYQPYKGTGSFVFGCGARYLAGIILTVSPWLIRNYQLMGSPIFSLQKYEPVMFTSSYPGYSLYMMLQKIDVFQFIKTHPDQILQKAVSGWAEFSSGLFSPEFTGISPWLFGLFLISLVMPLRQIQKNKWFGIRFLLVACFAIQLVVLLVIHFIYRLFFIFMPFYIIFGIAALIWILNKAADYFPVKKKGFVWVFSLILTGIFVVSNLPTWTKLPKEQMPINVLRGSVKSVVDMSTKNDLILSNDGHLLAWYGNRYAVKIPYSVDMIPEIEKLASVKYIYLSSRISWNTPDADKSWNSMFWARKKQIYGFRMVKLFEDGSILYRKEQKMP